MVYYVDEFTTLDDATTTPRGTFCFRVYTLQF